MGGVGSNLGKNSQILVVGFENSGKTLLIKKLIDLTNTENEDQSIQSTNAFDYVKIKIWNTYYDFWDLGGNDIARSYWTAFYRNLKFGFVFYLINIFDFDSHIESLKSLLILANEEELKQANFIIIFNVVIQGKKFPNNPATWKLAIDTKDKLMASLRENPIHDYDTRFTSILLDVSKIKDKEINTVDFIRRFNLNN